MFGRLFRGFQKSNAFNHGLLPRQPFMSNIRRNITRNYSSFSFNTDDKMKKVGYAVAIFGGMCVNAVTVHTGYIAPSKAYSIAEKNDWFYGDENVKMTVNIVYPEDIDSHAVIEWGISSSVTSVVFIASPLAGITLIMYKYILALKNDEYVRSEIMSNIRKKRISILEKKLKEEELSHIEMRKDFEEEEFFRMRMKGCV